MNVRRKLAALTSAAVLTIGIGFAAPAALADVPDGSDTSTAAPAAPAPDATTAPAESTASAAPTVDSGEPTQEPEAPASSSEPAPASEPAEAEPSTNESAPAEESGDDPSDAPAQPDAAERQDDSATQADKSSTSTDGNTSQQKENSATEAESSVGSEVTDSAAPDVTTTAAPVVQCLTGNATTTVNAGVRSSERSSSLSIYLNQAGQRLAQDGIDPEDGAFTFEGDFDGRRVGVGNYTVTSTVWVGGQPYDGNVVPVVITECNQPPTAGFTPKVNKLTVNVDGTVSTDPDGDELTYAWDFDGDGTVDSTEPKPTYTYATAGNKNVKLTVTDPDGASDSETKTVTVVANVPPIPSFDYEPDPTVPNGLTVQFRSTSTDLDGEIASENWLIDGVPDNGPEPRITFTSYGKKEVVLTATDNDGASVTRRFSIDVSEPQPNTTVTSKCVTDGLAFLLDNTTGTADGVGVLNGATYIVPAGGTRTATLPLDADGRVTVSLTLDGVVVYDGQVFECGTEEPTYVAPGVGLFAGCIPEGASTGPIQGSIGNDNDEDLVADVVFSNGTTASVEVPAMEAASLNVDGFGPDTYTATVTWRGTSVSTTVTVTVVNCPIDTVLNPTASIDKPYCVPEDSAMLVDVTLDNSRSNVPYTFVIIEEVDGTTTRYYQQVEAGEVGTGVGYYPAWFGEYIKLRVADASDESVVYDTVEFSTLECVDDTVPPLPSVDVCSNMPGVQGTVPADRVKKGGLCVLIEDNETPNTPRGEDDRPDEVDLVPAQRVQHSNSNRPLRPEAVNTGADSLPSGSSDGLPIGAGWLLVLAAGGACLIFHSRTGRKSGASAS